MDVALDDGRTVDVTSERLVFAAGASLTGAEIIAVATDELRLEAGSRPELRRCDRIPGICARRHRCASRMRTAGAAALGVSASRALFVEREGSAETGGRVTAAAGSIIASRGSLLVDGPEAVRVDGTINGSGAAWALGSRDVTIGGAAGEETSGLRVGTALLGNMAGASRLRLTANHELNFAESLELGSLREIFLDTPSIIASAHGVDARLSADRFTLLNSSSAGTGAPDPNGGSSLSLSARDFVLGPGDGGSRCVRTAGYCRRAGNRGSGHRAPWRPPVT